MAFEKTRESRRYYKTSGERFPDQVPLPKANTGPGLVGAVVYPSIQTGSICTIVGPTPDRGDRFIYDADEKGWLEMEGVEDTNERLEEVCQLLTDLLRDQNEIRRAIVAVANSDDLFPDGERFNPTDDE